MMWTSGPPCMPGKTTLSMGAGGPFPAVETDLVGGGGVLLPRQNQAGARAAQGLVRGGGDDVAVWDGRRMYAAGNQSGEVRHVHQVERTDLVGDLAHAGGGDEAGIRAAATDDELRAMFFRQLLDFVVVDGLGFLGHAVRHDLVC